MIPGRASITPSGTGFDFAVEAPGRRKHSGPYPTQEAAAEAAQTWANENSIQIELELAEGDRGAQQIEEL
jgi:hypothetical protein